MNKYQKLEKIGQGQFSTVFKVLNKDDNKFYVLKEILLSNLSKKEIELMLNESKILSTIKNDHIVKYYGSYQVNNTINLIMEFCEGSDLKKFILEHKNQNKLIEENKIYSMILDICKGLKEIHKKNLIHRDLKPDNLFLDNNNALKIGDFGISKQLSSNNKYATSNVGTSNYMAPEIISGNRYNNKVDIWALGCIIYELCTLEVCFQSNYLIGLCNKINNEPHGKINLNVYHKELQDLIDLLLKKNYKERPDINEVYSIIMKNKKNQNIKKSDMKGLSAFQSIFRIFKEALEDVHYFDVSLEEYDNEVKLAKERKEYGDKFLPTYEDYLNSLKRAHEQNLRFEIKWVRVFSKSTWSIKIKNQ